jgi:MFS family permease
MLRDRRLLALLVAETVSTTGSQMTWLALPWFVLTTTGSAGRMVAVLGAEAAGLILAGLPGGALLTRIGARRTMLLADAGRVPLTLAIPLLHWTGGLSFQVMLALVFGIGALSSPYFSAQRSIVPELIGEDEKAVSKANAFLQTATRLTMLLGPASAGFLIAWFGAPSVIVIDGISFIFSFALVAAFVPARRAAPPIEERGRFLDGLRFVLGDQLLRSWCVGFILGDAAWMAFFAAVPVLVVADYGADPRIAGWILASFGIGAVLGNFGSIRLHDRVDGLLLIGTLVYGQALPLWALVFHPPPVAISVTLFVSGIFNGLVNPSIHALFTLRAAPEVRARVLGALATVLMLSTPLGLLTAGPVLASDGPHVVLIGFAAVQTVAMTLVSVASLRARPTSPSALPARSP